MIPYFRDFLIPGFRNFLISGFCENRSSCNRFRIQIQGPSSAIIFMFLWKLGKHLKLVKILRFTLFSRIWTFSYDRFANMFHEFRHWHFEGDMVLLSSPTPSKVFQSSLVCYFKKQTFEWTKKKRKEKKRWQWIAKGRNDLRVNPILSNHAINPLGLGSPTVSKGRKITMFVLSYFDFFRNIRTNQRVLILSQNKFVVQICRSCGMEVSRE
jgi:hypothetical protein